MRSNLTVHPWSGWFFQILLTIGGTAALLIAWAMAIPGESGSVLFIVPALVIPGLFAAVTGIVVGLPLRLITPLWRWWNLNPVASLVALAVGTVLFALSLIFATPGIGVEPELGYEYPTKDPILWLLVSGWVLVTLSLVHFPMDARWRRSAPAEPVRGD